MKQNRKRLFLSIIILLSILVGLINFKKVPNNVGESLIMKKYLSDVEALYNVSFIDSLFISKKYCKNYAYVYIKTEYDCPGCIEIGDDIVHYLLIKNCVFIVDNRKNITRVINNEIESVQIDFNNKINSLHTPIILKIDSSFCILSAYLPGIQKERDLKLFIK